MGFTMWCSTLKMIAVMITAARDAWETNVRESN